MRVTIPYGKDGEQVLDIPDRNFAGVVYPNEVEATDEYEEVERAIDEPIGAPSLQEFLKEAKNVVFLINDATRPTPTYKVLDDLVGRMNLASARYLIATGSHRAPTEDEYRFIFGGHYENLMPHVHAHDSKKDKMEYLGKSNNGTSMWVNEIAADADRLIIITSVEPHYFAGYTGGRKSFLPGVASYETIEQNHRMAMMPEAQALRLKGNPVHEDMADALEIIKDKPLFSIQLVLDRHQNIYKVAVGDVNKAFEKAVEWADEVYSVKIDEKVDVVVSVAPYPMDVDLYQSQKALDNGKWALKEGGTIIFVSKCRDGIGHSTFLQQLSTSSDPRAVLENLAKEYKLGYHKAAKMAEIADWAEICGVTGIDPEVLRKANITPFVSVQSAVDAALAKKKDAKVLVLMEGSVTVPRVD
jgi:nickel-dependent lactate racemase